jgi:hypothetical protein
MDLPFFIYPFFYTSSSSEVIHSKKVGKEPKPAKKSDEAKASVKIKEPTTPTGKPKRFYTKEIGRTKHITGGGQAKGLRQRMFKAFRKVF